MFFQHPTYLIALAILPLMALFFIMVLRWKQITLKKIGNPTLVNQLLRGQSSMVFVLKFVLVALSLVALIIGIANLQLPGVMEKVGRKGVDVMIVLDVSKSMLAEDVPPNRLERAKQLVNKLVDKMPDDRVGLILFAGRAYMQMPLTTDHSMARIYLQNASPDIVPSQGTMIAEALRMANSAFNSKERKYKSVILITDGEDHDPASLTVAGQLSANGVMINTIGIGSPQGAAIIDRSTNEYKKDAEGNTVISKLNEPILQELAGATSGVYILLNNPDEAVATVMQQLGKIEATALEDNAFKNYKSYFQWFLGVALALLLVESLLPERKRKWKAG